MIDEPFRVIVLCVATKVYALLANRDFYKKKLDTRLDTHCIETGVQLWQRTVILIEIRQGGATTAWRGVQFSI